MYQPSYIPPCSVVSIAGISPALLVLEEGNPPKGEPAPPLLSIGDSPGLFPPKLAALTKSEGEKEVDAATAMGDCWSVIIFTITQFVT